MQLSEMQKQPSSKMCFVCGRDNPIGLHLHFYTAEDGRVHTEFTPRQEHQGYPGVMHGGLITSLLDETIGRTAIADDWWCMTAELEIRFKKPVPIGQPLHVIGEITQKKGRLLKARGEIRLACDDQLLVEAHGTFLKIPDDQIERYKVVLGGWRVDD